MPIQKLRVECRWIAAEFESVQIAQLIQVELFRRRTRLAQTQDVSLLNSQFSRLDTSH